MCHAFLFLIKSMIYSSFEFLVFLKLGQPRLLFHLFLSFKMHISNFTTNRNVKKCPSSIQCQDSNSQPLKHESPLITTRPGLSFNFFAQSLSLSLFLYPFVHQNTPNITWLKSLNEIEQVNDGRLSLYPELFYKTSFIIKQSLKVLCIH